MSLLEFSHPFSENCRWSWPFDALSIVFHLSYISINRQKIHQGQLIISMGECERLLSSAHLFSTTLSLLIITHTIVTSFSFHFYS